MESAKNIMISEQERYMPDRCTLREPTYTKSGTGTKTSYGDHDTPNVPCRKIDSRQQGNEGARAGRVTVTAPETVVIPASYTSVEEDWRVLITSLNGASVSIELEVKTVRRTTNETARVLECVRVE